MLFPALIYTAINIGSPETLRGWPVPTATDIAFAVGILALLGRRVPAALRVLLLQKPSQLKSQKLTKLKLLLSS